MIEIEKQDYDKLSPSQRKRYDYEKKVDPSLTHQQLITLVSANDVIRNTLKNGGQNINPNDSQFIQGVLKGISQWLGRNFPRIYMSIRDKLESTLEYIGSMIRDGIEYIKDNIWDIIVDFFS